MILIKMKESCFKVQQPPSKQQQTFKTFSLEMVMASFYFLKTGFYTITPIFINIEEKKNI